MEKCKDTLDSLLEDENYEISTKEWRSILLQIIMILITYQKCFLLRTMIYIQIILCMLKQRKVLYYKVNNTCYKVPTYGKIYKIIDFGRAIYKYKNSVFCSDSFSKGEDADTQYNTEPFFDENKPRLDPNMSFDLCRLGCSLFDYFIDDLEDQDAVYIENEMAALICGWCLDDKKRNILYKKNGEERYPEFKLYIY